MKKKKVIIFLFLITISFIFTIKWLSTKDFNLDNETLELLLENSGNIKPKNRIINTIVSTIRDSNIIDPVSNMLDDYSNSKEEVNFLLVSNEIEESKDNKPLVYIYNTHQTEKYKSSKEININYTVMDASFYLQKKLEDYGINSFVESMSVLDVLNTNNWNYASSYRVSKMFMEKRKKENASFKYFFDLHRDSVNKDLSTVVINGKRYARTLFLLGLENKSYAQNEKNIIKLENWLNKNYKGLSRGIYRKQGKGVNGVYNQDFSEYCFLIEIGGEDNNYEEVENTIDVIALMIKEFIGGKIE